LGGERGVYAIAIVGGASGGNVETESLVRCSYRVIAEGDDAVGIGLSIEAAVVRVEFARKHGKRYVAIVDDATGAIVDDLEAQTPSK